MQQSKPKVTESSDSISVTKMREAHSNDMRTVSQSKTVTESQMRQFHAVGGYIPSGYTIV